MDELRQTLKHASNSAGRIRQQTEMHEAYDTLADPVHELLDQIAEHAPSLP